MPDIFIDVETRSTCDLRVAGAHRYAAHGDTQVLVVCAAVGKGPIHDWRPGDPVPGELEDAICDGGVLHAWNAQFERLIYRHHMVRGGWPDVPLDAWSCVMARGMAMGLPGSLEQAAQAMKLPVEKDMDGRRLMMRMSRPRKVEGDCGIVWWEDDARMQRLTEYCVKDVEVTRLLSHRLHKLVPTEREVWLLDQRINDRGVLLDKKLVVALRCAVETETQSVDAQIRKLTGGVAKGASHVNGIRTWLAASMDQPVESLDKAHVEQLLDEELLDDEYEVLRLRQYAGKSSVAKLKRMLGTVCLDGRVRGLLQYHGAGTGRWAGRNIQVQNLPRQKVRDADAAARAAQRGHFAEMSQAVAAPERDLPLLNAVQALLRSTLVASSGHMLIGVDYSAIEARVLCWLANDKALMALFEAGRDVYMHDAYVLGSKDRQLGKVCRLALGYGMGASKLAATAAGYGITLSEEEAQQLVTKWRAANYKVPQLWRQVERAAIESMREVSCRQSARKVRYDPSDKGNALWCYLPSGRKLTYLNPAVHPEMTPWGDMQPRLSYETRIVGTQWGRRAAYGGLLVENLCQALARDVMAQAMLRLDAAGWDIVLTVHDEIVIETPRAAGLEDKFVEEIETIMCERPSWAPQLPLATEGWVSTRYGKH